MLHSISRTLLVHCALLLFLSPIVHASQPHQTQTVRVATPFAEGHILAEAAHRFNYELEKHSHHLNVVVATGVLNEQSINPASQSCNPSERIADVVFTGGQPIQDYAPEYYFFNGPYVIRDFEHLQSVWSSSIGKALIKKIKKNGNFVTFNPIYRGYRQFTSNTPINTPADLNGVLLRLPSVPDWISVWESLNVVPVQVPLTGIYDALANGIAEASEGDLTQIYSLNLYEVQDYLTLTNHLVSFGMPIVNRCFYKQEISNKNKQKIKKAMRRTVKWASHSLQANEADLLTDLQGLGMTVVVPDAAAIRTAAEPAINELFATKWNITTWAEVLAQ